MKKILNSLFISLLLTAAGFESANALPAYLTSFNSIYAASGTILDSCQLCHTSMPASKTNLNPFGVSYRDSGHDYNAINSLDSDNDGFTNITEIKAGVNPGDTASMPAQSAAVSLQMPVGQNIITHTTIYPAPVLTGNANYSMPFGFGAAVQGGDTYSLIVSTGNLAAAADIYLGIFMPADPNNIYLLKSDNSLQMLTSGLVPWKTVSNGVSETILLNSLQGLQPGAYAFALLMLPANASTLDNYYLWVSGFTVAPQASGLPIQQATDGAALYSQNCAACHGTLTSSLKAGKTAAQIQWAIYANAGNMGSLLNLASEQVQAIADALAQQTPPIVTPIPVPATDGAALYSQHCASCHSSLSASGKAGRTSSQIQAAINANAGGMGSLKSLSTEQVQAIADILAQQSPAPVVTDGTALYEQYCASCHKTLANSRVRGNSASEIREAIIKNKGGMGYLSSLTREQINSIANALSYKKSGKKED